MLNFAQKSLGGMKLVAIIVGVCVAGTAVIAISMMAGTHMGNPGYIPPPAVAPSTGHCYSFEINCHNPIKHGASYYESGQYLAP